MFISIENISIKGEKKESQKLKNHFKMANLPHIFSVGNGFGSGFGGGAGGKRPSSGAGAPANSDQNMQSAE